VEIKCDTSELKNSDDDAGKCKNVGRYLLYHDTITIGWFGRHTARALQILFKTEVVVK